jgi:hypothetical protein
VRLGRVSARRIVPGPPAGRPARRRRPSPLTRCGSSRADPPGLAHAAYVILSSTVTSRRCAPAEVVDEVGADEPGAAGDEELLHGQSTNVPWQALGWRYERHHLGRRHGLATAPDHARHQQAAHAGLRQADDLLPALDADAGRHPRRPGHHHARTTRRVRAAARRRQPVRDLDHLRRAALARWSRPGLHHRRRLHRRRLGRAWSSATTSSTAPASAPPAANTESPEGADLRLPRGRPHGVRRRGVRRRRHGDLLEEKPQRSTRPRTPCPGSTSTTTPSSSMPSG